jgi:DNA-binding Xre family transcriptional regulator
MIMKVMLADILKRRKITLYAFSNEIGMSYPALWKLATGKTKKVEFDTLEVICKALNIGIEELLYIEK